MMRTLMWKEYREHRLIWLAMLVTNCGALVGLSQLDQTFFSPRGQSRLEILGPVAALLVWGYGMICGAMLLAGEREEGTLPFLDILPVSRFRLWLGKGQVGLLLLVGQIVVLYGVLAGLLAAEGIGLLNGADASQPLWPFGLFMLVLGLIGMAYGLFFSARGENVLITIGKAVAGQIVAAIMAGLFSFGLLLILRLVVFFWFELRPRLSSLDSGGWQAILTLFTFFGLTLTAAAGSARIFSRGDRERRPVAVRRMGARASVVASWLRIFWLCYRQMYRLAVGVLAFSLFFGVLFLLVGPLLWPVTALFLGVLCGVSVFSDEQTLGSFRFLGDQRFPLGRIWVIKTGMRFVLLLLASFLILLPTVLVAVYYGMTDRQEPPLIREMPFLGVLAELAPWPTFLPMWPLYGFCAGQLCSLLSRKSIVAAMIALMISASLAIVWLPSLAGIGLHFWQIAGPPLMLLAAAAFLMRAWAADGLASRRTYLGVGAVVAASLMWTAFGIWYRVLEVPLVAEPFDVAAYKASLPTMDENKAGQLIRRFWGQVETAMNAMRDPRTNKPLFPDWNKVVEDGWPAGKSELGEWMDKTFADDWLGPLAPLPDLPLGMVTDPHLLTLDDLTKSKDLPKWRHANDFSALLAVRGLQQQARGDPAVFVEHMRIALALSRNLQHHSPAFATIFMGRMTAKEWMTAVDSWLKKLRGRPELLRRALQTLIDQEAQQPAEEEEFRAMYLILRNTLTEAPQQLLHIELLHDSKEKERHEGELQTAVMLWLFPWEQERHQRLFHLTFRDNDPDRGKIIEWGGRTFANLGLFTRGRLARILATREVIDLRACQLKVALRLYEEEHGDLPGSLDALAPRYFPSLPRDPFGGGQPFRYRRSRGEWIAWGEPREHPAQPQGMANVPGGEVPLMPRADEAAAPARARAMPGAIGAGEGRIVIEHGNLPAEGMPFMPHVNEPMRPPLPVPMAGGQLQVIRTTRFVPEGQGILWSVGGDGVDDGGKDQGRDHIYLVPPLP